MRNLLSTQIGRETNQRLTRHFYPRLFCAPEALLNRDRRLFRTLAKSGHITGHHDLSYRIYARVHGRPGRGQPKVRSNALLR